MANGRECRCGKKYRINDTCIFHGPIERKNPEQFARYFEEYYGEKYEEFKATGEPIILDCEGFIFPSFDCPIKKFELPVNFRGATFKSGAWFYEVEFVNEANFKATTFEKEADFRGVKFKARAEFSFAVFNDGVKFGNTEFRETVIFYDTRFNSAALFLGTKFLSNAIFRFSRFTYTVAFEDVEFEKAAIFNQALFDARISFNNTKFKGVASFTKAKFVTEVRFSTAIFNSDAIFNGGIFENKADFSYTQFGANATFTAAKFQKTANFLNAKFGTNGKNDTKPISNTSFWKTEFLGNVDSRGAVFQNESDFTEAVFNSRADFRGAVFYRRASFANAIFIGRVDFGSVLFRLFATFEYAKFHNTSYFVAVGKSEKSEPSKIKPGSKVNFSYVDLLTPDARIIFDDVNLRDWSFGWTVGLPDYRLFQFEHVEWEKKGEKRKSTRDEDLALLEKGVFTCEMAAEVYRRLRKNYEDRLAYEAASDFHIGQMEMLLKNPDTHWLKKRVLWLYRAVSNFGESVGWPLIWFGALWATFFAIWLVLPARHEFAGVVNTLKMNFDWPWEWLSKTRFPDITEFGWYIWRKFWFTASNFITFPKPEGTYFERFLGGFQRFLGVTIVTFFILALRRAFRR